MQWPPVNDVVYGLSTPVFNAPPLSDRCQADRLSDYPVVGADPGCRNCNTRPSAARNRVPNGSTARDGSRGCSGSAKSRSFGDEGAPEMGGARHLHRRRQQHSAPRRFGSRQHRSYPCKDCNRSKMHLAAVRELPFGARAVECRRSKRRGKTERAQSSPVRSKSGPAFEYPIWERRRNDAIYRPPPCESTSD